MQSRIDKGAAGTRFKRWAIYGILAAIIVFSISASIALYSIQLDKMREIDREQRTQLKNQLSEKSFHVSQLAAQHVSSILKITQILSNDKSFQSGDIGGIRTMLDAAKKDSAGIVDSFFVLDKDGILLYTTTASSQSNIGTSFSNHITYVNTRDSMDSYISPLVFGSDNASRIFVASPIIDDQTREFRGLVSAAVRADTFANSIEGIVIPKNQTLSETLALIDPKGMIMYAGASHANLGKNVLSEEVLSAIPSGIKEGLVESLREAISGTAGIYELNLAEHPELSNPNASSASIPMDYVLIAYNPVKVDDHMVMISLLTKAVSLKGLVQANEPLEISSMFGLIYGMLGTMSAFAISIVVINRRLERSVKLKTDKLEKSNKQLWEATERISEQAKELKEVDIKKSEFSAMITHELKTPLVSVIGYGSMFLNGKLGELTSFQKQKLQIMQRNAQRLSVLIQDILDMQKLELGELHLNIKEASAKDMIEQSISTLKPIADSKNIKLNSSVKKDLKVKCDSGRIMQVINNLVNNGIKFSSSDSRIEISANLVDHSVVFGVRDDGVGIPPEKQGKIFTKFYQADTSLTRKSGGTGLGLVISKGIVEAHRGKMWFQSQAGKGSIFSFSLPTGETSDEKENTSSR